MAIPKINEQNIIDALKFIDENGVPVNNKSTQYVIISDEGKQYPPKYVIAVANHLANGDEISTEGYTAIEAKNYFESRGYNVETKQEKYELTITASEITSTNELFDLKHISLGDNYKPIDACFISANGETVRRVYNKAERRNTNQTLPRLAFQVFENSILNLSDVDKKNFPICKYEPESEVICGIFSTKEDYWKYRLTREFLVYRRDNGPQFVIYCWNIFSTIIFVQECLKRFGNDGDRFVLVYRDKTEQEKNKNKLDDVIEEDEKKSVEGCKNHYSKMLLESKNIIFRGAPGTGKSYLAKQIAADIISNGYTQDYIDLTEEQLKQVEFVQFHPSYDYSDFVEGLRPRMNEDGTMGFELQDGIFKKFVERARKNYENSNKSIETIKLENSAKTALNEFLANIDFADTYKTIYGNEFEIYDADEKNIYISIPKNEKINKLRVKIDEILKMLESNVDFEKVTDITNFFGRQYGCQTDSYDFAIYKAIKEQKNIAIKTLKEPETLKKYVFIIDEINRGEISKILGELFFSIDPGYRGKSGEVSTQYSNMHSDTMEKFYIPENVFIIGTMNDIDRSVDSFDFAMRRRFRFLEVKAEDTQDMLDSLEDEELKNDAIVRMDKLNKAIVEVPDLNRNYQIGASYFLKLKNLKDENAFDYLWTDYLQPLLQEYVHGLNDEEEYMQRFAKAYGYKATSEGDTDGTTQN